MEDMLRKLKLDHRKICAEIEQMMEAAESNRKQLFYQLKDNLILHMKLEEKLLYPLMKESDETHDRVLESCEEHRELKRRLELLGKAFTDTVIWRKLLYELKENFNRHTCEEEQSILKQALGNWWMLHRIEGTPDMRGPCTSNYG